MLSAHIYTYMQSPLTLHNGTFNPAAGHARPVYLHSGFHELSFLGTTRRCLNLGSYNYLGFAAADEYCTPRVQRTIKELGVSGCSSRVDAGEGRGVGGLRWVSRVRCR